ncbi:MAG TPA: peptidylprolyl isomerase [Gemmatimonadaceae bacterium]|jgi:peptidyl-prolyl cis-trans isomerase A (cyclophilin A)|nr:peptidylprolyl isomerase [Gemmatimonadaceae bacterium]
MKKLLLTVACLALVACGRKAAPPSTATAGTTPESYRVRFETSKGPFTVAVTRSLSPRGADRFYELVTSNYFNDVRFFRVVPGFVAQFGMNGDPKLNEEWADKPIPDDSVKETNARGTLVFATSGPNSRSNQLFINLADNGRLDKMGFSPFGKVVDGMAVVDSLYSGYGESPSQQLITVHGNAYLTRNFPKLDYIKSAAIVPATDTGTAK